MNIDILPYGNIRSPEKLGQAVRAKRKANGLTQAKAAALCGVGVRFISDLENGKPTVELGKTLSVLAGLGLTVNVLPKGNLDKTKAKKLTSLDAIRINQVQLPDSYLNAISKLSESYNKSLNLSSDVIDQLSKHRMDFSNLGISMDKYNGILNQYGNIRDISSTAASSLSNFIGGIDKVNVSRATLDSALDTIKKSMYISQGALDNINTLKSTVGSLNLDAKTIDALQANYKNNIQIARDVLTHKLDKLISLKARGKYD